MAEKTPNRKNLDLTGLQKLWIAGALLFFLLNLLLMCIFGLNVLLFTGNERFTLREVVIEPPAGYEDTYWNNERENNRNERIGQICRDLQLVPGTTNLFELDLREMRETMLQKNPEIQTIEIRKTYPDQLQFMIRESSPYLKLGKGRCLNEKFKVVCGDRFERLDLPLFQDFSDDALQDLKPGDEYQSKPAEFALNLTKHLQEKFPAITPVRIRYIKKDHYMDCLIKYESHIFRVFLPYPVKLEEDLYRNKIPQLNARLQALHREEKYSVTIDLIYKDPIIRLNQLPEKQDPEKK